MQTPHKKLLGFTLVELIVVITIVAILSTVGFVSYSGYLSGARDSNRMSQLVKLSDSLQVYSTTRNLPLPDDYIEVQASGSTIAYQGKVGADVLETIDYTNGGVDPKDDSYYTYYLTNNRNSMQLLTFMEDAGSVAGLTPSNTQTYAAEYTGRFPKTYGRKLGVLTETEDQGYTPVEDLNATVDVVDTSGTSYVAHISDDEQIEGTGATLQQVIPNGSCKRIKQTGGAGGNGTYSINPAGTGKIEVYCDMETAGGGWTMVARSIFGGTGDFGWLFSQGEVFNESSLYSLGLNVKNINFEKILYTTYSNGYDIDLAVSVSTDDSIVKLEGDYSEVGLNCIDVKGQSGLTVNANGICSFSYWGFIPRNGAYHFEDTTWNGYGLTRNGYNHPHSFGNFNGEQGMIFIK